MVRRVWHGVRAFAKDLTGSAVAENPDAMPADTPASALIASVALLASLKTAFDLLSGPSGSPSALIPLGIAFAGILVCGFAIASKTGDDSATYRFGVWTRRVAKVALLVLCIIAPLRMKAAIAEYSSLRSPITGIILDAATREPIPQATVRVLDRRGVDITLDSTTMRTDSSGVFIVSTHKQIRADATISVYRDGWKPASLRPAREFRTKVPPDLTYVSPQAAPFFTFYVEFQK